MNAPLEHARTLVTRRVLLRAAAMEPAAAKDWAEVHRRIVDIARRRAAGECELCGWLLAAERLGVHVRAGYASLREYAERVAGLSGRQTEERLRVGRALVDLPRIDHALTRGQLSWSAARELTRVATRETEAAWLSWAEGKRVRQIEQAVATRQPGDRPADRPDPSRQRYRLSFEVRARDEPLGEEPGTERWRCFASCRRKSAPT
jgi:hypothetical protein